MLLLVAMLTAVSAWAVNPPSLVSGDPGINSIQKTDDAELPTYLDKDGNQKTCEDFTYLTAETQVTARGWYVVEGEVEYKDFIEIWNDKGDVNLILADNATLRISGVSTQGYSFLVRNGNLNIYAQSTGSDMGTISTDGFIWGYDGNVNIYGGNVITTACYSSFPYGICASSGNVNIYNGYVDCKCSEACSDVFEAIQADNVTIYGGSVNPCGGGIYASDNITISGGDIYAASNNSHGIVANNVTISGGLVYAKGKKAGIHTRETLTITGGDITAECSGVEESFGIESEGNNNKISLSNASDYIIASSYNFKDGDLTFGDNLVYEDADGQMKSVTKDAISNIAGKMIILNGSHILRFDTGFPDHYFPSQVVASGEKTVYPDYIPGHKGLRFENWYSDKELTTLFAFDSELTENTTVYANWSTYYLGDDGNYQETNSPLTILTSETDLNGYLHGGWYVVLDEVTLDKEIKVDGDMNLILADGAELNINGYESYLWGYSFFVESANLNIYAQSTGENMGSLNAYGSIWGRYGDITINGGNVSCTARSNENPNGIYASDDRTKKEKGNVTINGGTVTATGEVGICADQQLTINGGKISATGTTYGLVSGNITLGLTDPTDFIFASSYAITDVEKGTIKVAKDKKLYYYNASEGKNTELTGDIYAQADNIAGKKLLSVDGHVLSFVTGIPGYSIPDQIVTVDITTKEPSISAPSGLTLDGWYADKGFNEEFNFGGELTKSTTVYAKWSVKYLDKDGYEQTLDQPFTILTQETDFTQAFQGGWYVAIGTISTTDHIYVKDDDMNLILANGAKLTINPAGKYDDGTTKYAIEVYGTGSLNIYAQSNKEAEYGQLDVNALYANTGISINGGYVHTSGKEMGIYAPGGGITINGGDLHIDGTDAGFYAMDGNITINGGEVRTTSDQYALVAYNGSIIVNGGYLETTGYQGDILVYSGTIEINGGRVHTNGYGSFGIHADGDITINGGHVHANGSTIGIYADGNITLGWSDYKSDAIWASSYYVPVGKTISVTSNFYYYDKDKKIVAAGTTITEPYSIANNQLIPFKDITIYGDEDYDVLLPEVKGVDVTYNRSFHVDFTATWMLPFEVNTKDINGFFYTIKEVVQDEETGVWEAHTSDQPITGELAANTPYIFVPKADITELKFNNVNIEANSSEEYYNTTEDKDWTLVGMYVKKTWDTPTPTEYGFAASPATNDAGESISAGEFVRAGRNTKMKPTRAFLRYSGTNETLKSKSGVVLPERIVLVFPDATSSVVDPADPSGNGSDDVTTPVSELTPKADNAKVWSYDKTIYIAAAPGIEYRIIDALGRPLQKGITATDRDELRLGKHSGMVIVFINGKSYKLNY